MRGSLRAASLAGLLACLPVGFVAATAMAAGPPYPDPIIGAAVYDEAGVLSSDAEAELESRIDEIEAATGAEIVIYTQVKPESDTVAEAEADAVALGEQWGVGREGFDDGLVILLDLDESLCHGQAQLNAAVGFREAYLSNAARQRIYDERMLPRLRECDMDGAMLVAMEEIGAATIPERAAELNRARLVDAIIGIVIAGIVVIGFVGWMVLSWWRYGRDPKLADSDSIHIPAPPPELTPASAALVYDGVSSRRTLTTAMIDLASRGHIAFDEIEEGLLLKSKKVAILIGAPAPDDPEDEYERSQAQRTPISEAEQYALKELGDIAADGRIEPDDMLKFGSHVATFDKKLEAYAVKKGWFTRAPKEAVRRWRRWAVVVAVIGAVALIVGFNIPSGGLVSLGVGSLAAAIVGFVISGWMPARTKSGALTRIMLSAYRRTLEKTMAMARSMDQVVREAGLPWLDSPDRAVVWGVALGLHPQVEEVLKRTADDLGDGRVGVGSAYTPAWYGSFSTGGGSYSGGPGGSIMSSSAIPSFGGMMAVLGTIGNTPSSSGGGGFGGGGGFSGGGGGGGAGGGF